MDSSSIASSPDPLPVFAETAGFISGSIAFYVVVLLAIGLLLALSAIISGAEVAFFSLSHDEVMKCKTSNDKVELRIADLLKDPKHLLATILILNNLFNVSVVTLSTFLTWELVGKANTKGIAIVILTSLVTFAIVFFGEVIPKIYASQRGMQLAKNTSAFLSVSNKIMYPFSWLLTNLGNVLEKRIHKRGYHISVEELNKALELTTEKNTTEEEKEILKGIVNFGTITVRQVMRTRMDISSLDIETSFIELIEKVNQLGYSRIPVYRDTVDKIEGILYIKDLLPHIEEPEEYNWRSLLRTPYFIPENKKIDSLLKDFQAMQVHIAIVVDEYGGTAGLITMEDIIEEIVGEINDEFDEEQIEYTRTEDNAYIFEGKTSLNDFCKILDVHPDLFEKVRGDSESLGGLLLELNEGLPETGEKITYGRFTFEVISVDTRKINTVKIVENEEKENL